MLATFFQWRIKPGRRVAFEEAWTQITRAYHAQGSLGSALFEREDGTLCAFARWPDRATRDAAFAMDVLPEATAQMRDAVEETVQRFDMDGVVDLWTGPHI